jgi:predicted TPR repeat methyltransferase
MSTLYAASMEQLLAEGERLLDAQRPDEADANARQVLAQQARNPRAHGLLAAALLMRERHAEALEHVEAALRNDRVNARLHFMAALCQGPLGRVDEAIASYRRALQYRPDFVEARANLGYVLEGLGRPDEAADCYRRVLGTHPREWFCLNRLGYCERVAGRPAEAAALLERAASLRPDAAATLNELALAYLALERKPDAIAAFRRAVEADPAFPAAPFNLAKVLYLDFIVDEGAGRTPDPAPLLACFDRALALDPGNVEFGYLRDCVAGVRRDRPPDAYIAGFFDRFAERFDDKLVGELGYRGPEVAAEFAKPYLDTNTDLRIVDLGCGTGLAAGFLRTAARTLVGVDLSGGMLEQARGRGVYDELVQEEIVAFLARSEPGSIDFALALDVFIYVGDLGPALTAAARALRPGGRMVISVELADADAEGFALLSTGRYAHSTGYVETVALAAGFSIADSRPFTIRHDAGEPLRDTSFALERK